MRDETVLTIPCDVVSYAVTAKGAKAVLVPLGADADALARYVGGRVDILIDPDRAWPGAVPAEEQIPLPLNRHGADDNDD